MQYYYNEKNVNYNYLCSYVKTFFNKGKVEFYNTLFNTSISFSTSLINVREFLFKLQNGLTNEELIQMFSSITSKPEELVKYMIKKGFIE